MSPPIIPVNGRDRNWTRGRYVLAFDAYGSTRLMVWANSLEEALDEAIDWLAEHAPGILCDEEVAAAYLAALESGLSDEQAITEAKQDTTCGGNQSNYIHAFEWFILAENPSRATVLQLQGRPRYANSNSKGRLAGS